MKKKNIAIILFILSALLAVTFTVFLCVDYFAYYPFGSAPFYLYVIVRAAEFLIAALISLTIGIILWKSNKKS